VKGEELKIKLKIKNTHPVRLRIGWASDGANAEYGGVVSLIGGACMIIL
jgi:hypothetical protein